MQTKKIDELLEEIIYCDLRTSVGVDKAKKAIRKSLREKLEFRTFHEEIPEDGQMVWVYFENNEIHDHAALVFNKGESYDEHEVMDADDITWPLDDLGCVAWVPLLSFKGGAV